MAEVRDDRPDELRLTVNGRPIAVSAVTTIAAAILISAQSAFRRSVSGQPRGPLCGMGICFECRATVDGLPHRRTCQTPARDGMEVVTDGV
jgi:aerobic-type carbon monoxide dehydrogenase small subunit (CoxS/CutS family)